MFINGHHESSTVNETDRRMAGIEVRAAGIDAFLHAWNLMKEAGAIGYAGDIPRRARK